MMVFKRKQIVVLSLVLMIVVAGYLQYSYKRSSTTTSGREEGRLGEAVYVDNKEAEAQLDDENGVITENDVITKEIPASKEANDFFAQAVIDKEASRSMDKEALQQITEDTNAAKEAKAEAYNKMMAIVENSQKEMRVETLVKKNGFDDVLALIADDGSMDIVVKSPGLTSAQVAQITDIVNRQAKIEIEKIHIKNKY